MVKVVIREGLRAVFRILLRVVLRVALREVLRALLRQVLKSRCGVIVCVSVIVKGNARVKFKCIVGGLGVL